MKDIVKVLQALSFEGFKACLESAGKKSKQPAILESSDGLFFATPFTGYFIYNSNMYNLFDTTSPFHITHNMPAKDACSYELHYVMTYTADKETYIKLVYNNDPEQAAYINNKIVPKALKNVITDRYTKYYTTSKDGKSIILVYSEPYTLALLMPTMIKEDKKK